MRNWTKRFVIHVHPCTYKHISTPPCRCQLAESAAQVEEHKQKRLHAKKELLTMAQVKQCSYQHQNTPRERKHTPDEGRYSRGLD